MKQIILIWITQLIEAQMPGGARMGQRMGYGPRQGPPMGAYERSNLRPRNVNLKTAGNTNGDPNWSVAGMGPPNTVDNFGGSKSIQLALYIME